MEQDINEYIIRVIKRVIKRAYEQYKSERTDGVTTIADLAKSFNIPIDESRLEDYEIKEINYDDELSMELMDKRNNIVYRAKYIYSYGQKDLRYIDVIATSPSKEVETIYNVGTNNPALTKIAFVDGEYKLTFENEKPNDAGIYYRNPNKKFTIRYSVDNCYDKNKVEDWLLSKTIQKHDDGEFVYDFERTQTNQIEAIKKNLDSQSKHSFIESDNVMYGVDSFQTNLHNCVKGACFESTKISHIKEHFPSSMDLYKPSSKFTDENTMSAIILNGYVGDGNYSELEVYKTTEGIVGSYYVKNFSTDEPHKLLEQKNNFQLQNLDEGMITSREISYLLENLRSRFKDSFIELISDDLLEFAKKIDIRKGILEEDLNLLSPKLFFDKSLEEIENMVESNKNEYFKLARDEYFAMSHQKQDKGQVKALKLNNNSQSSKK